MTEPSLEPILAYLRESSGRYSIAALRRQLLETGHTADDVDLAIQIFQHENPTARPRVWPWMMLIVTFNTVLTIGLSASISQPYWIAGVTVLAFLICVAELVLGLVFKMPRNTRYGAGVLLRGMGLFAGLALLVLGGVCTLGPF
jgi:FtsH-binding integral membrane protein